MSVGRAISVVKLAAVDRAAVELAHSAGKIPGVLIRTGKGALNLAGEIGEGIAQGSGAAPGTGRTIGKIGLLGAAAYTGSRAKDKLENWKYQHGFYNGG